MATGTNDDRQYLEVGELDSVRDYQLTYQDVEVGDVVLLRMLRDGLKVGVPWSIANNPRAELPLSREVTSSSLQYFINSQFGRNFGKHRAFTQLREVRDHCCLERKHFSSETEALNDWRDDGHGHAAKFYEEYNHTFERFRKIV